MVSKRQAAAAALFLLLAAGCGGGKDGGEAGGGARDGAEAASPAGGIASVTLRGIDGPDRSIADYEGRILVVNLVATWNNDSKDLVGIMNEIQRGFRRNVDVIAVALDDRGPEGARMFARQTGAAFDVFLGGDSVRREFGRPSKFPTTYVLTRDARIFAKIEGLQRYDYYHNTLIRMYQQRL